MRNISPLCKPASRTVFTAEILRTDITWKWSFLLILTAHAFADVPEIQITKEM